MLRAGAVVLGKQAGGRPRGAAHRLSDLVERLPEDVMQHERDPLGRRQSIQNDEKCHVHSVRLIDEIRKIRGRIDRFVAPRLDIPRALAGRPRRAEHVEAEARDDCRAPCVEVVDLSSIRSGMCSSKAQPRLLNGILGVGTRSEQSRRNRLQSRAGAFEPLCEFLVVHVTSPHRHSS